jgi:hypothetical protein
VVEGREADKVEGFDPEAGGGPGPFGEKAPGTNFVTIACAVICIFCCPV